MSRCWPPVSWPGAARSWERYAVETLTTVCPEISRDTARDLEASGKG